jgi:orotate phosphoribosyltransferase
MPKLQKAANVNVTSFIITVDRMERALDSELSAVQATQKEFGIKVYSIANINDIIAALESGAVEGAEYLPAMRAYIAEYGAKY